MNIAKPRFVTSIEIKIAHQENKWSELQRSFVRGESLVFHADVWFSSLWPADNSVSHTKATTCDSFILIHPWIFYLTTFSFCLVVQGRKEPFQNWIWNNVFKTCWILCLFQPFVLYLWKSSHSALIDSLEKSCAKSTLVSSISMSLFGVTIIAIWWLTKINRLTWVYPIKT